MGDPEHPRIEDVTLQQIMHALSDPVRLHIVAMAARQGEQPCQTFTQNIPKSTASHHWKVLREAGLIYQRVEGTKKLNSLRKAELDRRFPGLLDAVLADLLNDAEGSAV